MSKLHFTCSVAGIGSGYNSPCTSKPTIMPSKWAFLLAR